MTLPAGSALAQSTTSASASDDSAQKLPEVVVTGEQAAADGMSAPVSTLRLEESILDAPRSVKVIDKTVIEEQLVLEPQDAVRNVSGVARAGSYTGQGENYILRGFTQNDLIKDGFRAGEASNTGLTATGPTDMANVNRVEVLKGPTAILYGRGEPGGIVNYITEQPSFENKVGLQQYFGSDEFYRTDLEANWNALPDRLALRLDAAFDSTDSFLDYVNGERYFVAPSLLWQAGAQTTISFRGEYSSDDRSNSTIHPYTGGAVPAGLDHGTYVGEPGLTDFENDTLRGLLKVDHEWNSNNRTSLSFHARSAKQDGAYLILFDFSGGPLVDADGNVARALAQIDWDDQSSVFRAEHVVSFPLLTGTVAAADNDLLIAFEHESQDDDRHRLLSGFPRLNVFDPAYSGFAPEPLVPFPGFPLFIDETSAAEATATSLLLLDRVSFQDRLFLSFGGRVEWFAADQSFTYGAGAPFASYERDQDHTMFNPSVGLVYKPIDPVSLYFSYAESSSSFRNFSLATESGEALEPERARQYELGAKTELLDGRLTATAAVFQIDKTDVAGTDPANPLFSINAGEERSRGVEFDLAYQPLPGWRLLGNYAYVDARIESDPTGANDGNHRYGAPEHSGSFWTTYEFQGGPIRGFGLGGGVFLASEVAVDNANTGTLDGYTQTDLLAYYQRSNWRAQLNVRNVFDEEYYFATGNATMVQPAATRAVIGSITIEF